MRTRKPTPAEEARYRELRANSPHAQAVDKLAREFYANGVKFRDEAHSKAHKEACDAWNAERDAAGFYIAQTGLRIITQR